VEDTKWWLLELIPIGLKERKLKRSALIITRSTDTDMNFIKVDIGGGHSTYKVFWRREGAKNGTRIAWLQ
jgi:hypothetical protein